jgi:hypothetical protein
MEDHDDDPPQTSSRGKIVLAVLSFLGFSITLPPLGFLMFLGLSGIIDKRSLGSLMDQLEPIQDVLMGFVIVGFGILCVIAVTIQNSRISRMIYWLILSLAAMSIGGCVMGLSNLKSIGS